MQQNHLDKSWPPRSMTPEQAIQKGITPKDGIYIGTAVSEEEGQLKKSKNNTDYPFHGRPPVVSLDVSKGWDSISVFDMVVGRLKKLHLYHKDLLYCAASWEDIDQLGFEYDEAQRRRTIQASTETEIRDRRAERNMAHEACELGTVIVYKPNMLRSVGEYRYLPPARTELRDAVIIVLRLISK